MEPPPAGLAQCPVGGFTLCPLRLGTALYLFAMLKATLSAKTRIDALVKLPGRVRRTLERVIAEEAAETAADARERAPRDTGALQESIHAEQTDVLTWEVRDGVPYGIFQEFGARFHAAQPFMTPALHAAEIRLEGRLATALNETLRRRR